MPRQSTRPDYGIDAPGVIINLLVIGFAALAIFLWTPRGYLLHLGFVAIEVRPTVIGVAVLCIAEGLLMLLYAKWGKFRHRDRMLALHAWRGDEQVLDVGTGRGLMLVGAARRLIAGRAIGIDIWRGKDLSGNSETATQQNLQLEKVADRCELRSMGAQQMEFPDGSFDVILSNLCLHNIEDKAQRAAACREIVRVLKPGGVGLISDYKNTGEYARIFREAGCAVERSSMNLLSFPPLRIVELRKGAEK